MFVADEAPRDVKSPSVTSELIGTFELVGQGLDNPDGSALTIDTDITGATRNRKHPSAGPLENVKSGLNTIRLIAGPVNR